ncbi:MAG TPA: membrane protein insertase YidC [Steroidobacteraceae bacterium]|nr:membrane protein insertase YidC [Steroidobacteraceae bacterium]
MDNKRIIFWGTLGVLLWFNVMTWRHDYPETVVAPSATNSSALTSAVPTPPSASSASSNDAQHPAVATNSADAVKQVPEGSKIHITTDVLDIDINTRGGDIERADLLKYALSREQPNTLVRLLDDHPESKFIVYSGLSSPDPATAPTHETEFSSDASSYKLQDGKDELSVDLKWTDGHGVNITKSFVFHRGSYAVDVRYSVENTSKVEWRAASYVQLYRHDLPVKRSMFNAETYSYRGPMVFDGSKAIKLAPNSDEAKNFDSTITGGWIAALQHHFVVAAIPDTHESAEYTLKRDTDNDFALTYRGPVVSVDPDKTKVISEKLFIGPKLQKQLVATGPKLELTVDYGRLTLIAEPLFDVLKFVHKGIGNWGVDIIIVTLLIKAAFYWLTASSGRSMAKMRTLAPKLKALQERYKDDREQLGRATMELYRKEKVNPIAGCLPMLIQMPFLMGFYWVLIESAEMHQAPFVGWITDLSARDPYFILPIIMGIANFIQFKVNPPQADPTQAKIMAFMPIVMTVMMAWFPAGLLLYWITNTLVSVLQQWRINQLVAADAQRGRG